MLVLIIVFIKFFEYLLSMYYERYCGGLFFGYEGGK